jgi:hypothetical protein
MTYPALMITGLAASLAATTAMTLVEIPFWKKWGIKGVLEWHENQVLVSKLFGVDQSRLDFPGIFLLHFANGSMGGLALLFAIEFVPQLLSIPVMILALLYGLFLWVLTLAPIHKPITGLHPWNHPLGKGPALVSLGGHAIYGLVLGTIFLLAIY